jgi:hypothetical protein
MWIKIGIVSILSILYSAYLVEMYRHLTKPLESLGHQNRQKKIKRLIIFFIGIAATIIFAYVIREFLLPRPIFDLIIVSLQTIFIIPFFGAIFTDRLLHMWRQQRLPYPITLLVIICMGIIGTASNLLILFASEPTIQKAAYSLEFITDITTIGIILMLGFLGIGYLRSTKKQ